MNRNRRKINIGVLNITICLEKLQSREQALKSIDQSANKYQNSRLFIPRNIKNSYNYQQKTDPDEPNVRNYKKYIRNFRNHVLNAKNLHKQMACQTHRDKMVQHENQQSLQQKKQQSHIAYSKEKEHKLVFKKKVSKNKPCYNRQLESSSNSKWFFQLGNEENSINQQNIRNIFTVRSIKTSRENRQSSLQNKQKMPKKSLKIINRKVKNGQIDRQENDKFFRPWSTSRNGYNGYNNIELQSMMIIPNEQESLN